MQGMNKKQIIVATLLILTFIMTACGAPSPATPTNAPISTITIITDTPTVATTTPSATLQASSTMVPPTMPATVPAPTAAAASPTTVEAGPMVTQQLRVPDALKTGVFAQDLTLNLPQEFGISVFDAGLTQPRWIVTGPDGRLWVTELGAGRVLVYDPQGAEDDPTPPRVFADALNRPHGIAFHDDYVYIAETTRVLRIRNANGQAVGAPEVIISGLPSGGHVTRTLLFTPDNRLLVSIGSSCNVCRESDERRAAVMVYDTDGGNGRLYATGLRNAVGLTLHPETSQIWFTNNGRDMLGDDVPKEIIGPLQEGADYGWPDCYGDRVVDSEFGGDAARCAQMVVPELQVQAHSAPLGLTFLPTQNWSAPYAGNMIIAYHGSWNRSVPTGYKLVRVPMTDGQVAGADLDFLTGFELPQDGDVWGCPVAAAVGTDGALYVTDDRAGAIYRIFQSAP